MYLYIISRVMGLYMCMCRSSKVVWKDTSFHFKLVYMGTKGDWPFLRSALKLRTGWNCLRICHLCNEADPLLQRLPHFVTSQVMPNI